MEKFNWRQNLALAFSGLALTGPVGFFTHQVGEIDKHQAQESSLCLMQLGHVATLSPDMHLSAACQSVETELEDNDISDSPTLKEMRQQATSDTTNVPSVEHYTKEGIYIGLGMWLVILVVCDWVVPLVED